MTHTQSAPVEEWDANARARLIAAAPELLAVLRHVLHMIEGMDDPHFTDAIKQASAAIDKAEGR